MCSKIHLYFQQKIVGNYISYAPDPSVLWLDLADGIHGFTGYNLESRQTEVLMVLIPFHLQHLQLCLCTLPVFWILVSLTIVICHERWLRFRF